jgi:hypothetical protein
MTNKHANNLWQQTTMYDVFTQMNIKFFFKIYSKKSGDEKVKITSANIRGWIHSQLRAETCLTAEGANQWAKHAK